MTSLLRPMVLACLLLHLSFLSISQNETIVKYYDSTWQEVPGKSAHYISRFKSRDDIYICNTYWAASQKLYSIAAKLQATHYAKTIGLSLGFHENGRTRDSTYYDANGSVEISYHYFDDGKVQDSIFYGEEQKVDSAWHYHKNGSLKVRYIFDKKTKQETTNAFDETGQVIKNYVYYIRSEFPGGALGWRVFLQNNLDPLTPINKKAPDGTYQVIARFIILKDGTLSDLKTETTFGFGMEQEVLRVLRKSPRWSPEVFLNEKVTSLRRQPVTFVVSGR